MLIILFKFMIIFEQLQVSDLLQKRKCCLNMPSNSIEHSGISIFKALRKINILFIPMFFIKPNR